MEFKAPNNKFPNSFLKVECKVPANREEQFDYMDNFQSHSVAIRLGRKGILGLFDGGIHEYIFPDFAARQFDNKPLHPVQFKEIFAKLTYKSILSLRVPYFGLIEDKEYQSITVMILAYDDYRMRATAMAAGLVDGPIVMMPILPPGLEGAPFYGEWSQEEFARYLSVYTGIPFERLFAPPDLVATTIRNESGEFVDLPL